MNTSGTTIMEFPISSGEIFETKPAILHPILRDYQEQFYQTLKKCNFFFFVANAQPLSRLQLFVTPWTAALQLPCPSSSPRACSNTCPLSRWCHLTILSFWPLLVLPSIFPSIRVFSKSQLFPSGDQSTGTSASTSVLSMNIKDWFPLGLTGWISLLSKRLSRVFSNTIVQNN